MTRLDGTFTGARRPEEPWRRRKPFSRMPQELWDIKPEQWVTCNAGLWKFLDDIALGETRAVVTLARIVASASRAHGYKIASLQDNTVCAASLTKGRSPAPALNFLARKKGAYTLAGDLVTMLPRVETGRQPADGASREL